MVITIHSSYIVFPSEPTPNGILQLSESDQFMGWTHEPTIYVYESSPQNADVSLLFDSLKNSLSQILVPYYPLAGRLRWIAGSRFEVDCCAAGAEITQASCDMRLEDFNDFAPTNEVRELAPKVDYSAPMAELPLFLVQITKFSCGGLTVGIAISHILTDGFAAIMFINSWANIARGEKTKDTVVPPYLDRKLLQPEQPIKPPRFCHEEYQKPPLPTGCTDANEERKRETTVALLKVSKEQVEKLKNKANKEYLEETAEGKGPTRRRYSCYECVAGHMWVSACKARSTGQKWQPTRFRVGADIRRRLRPPLPEGFAGNATLVVSASSEFGDLITKPLSYAAEMIREGTWKLTNEYARSAIDFLAGQEDIARVRTAHHTLGYTGDPFWGNPNMTLGSWITMPVYDADFGWGRPRYMGPAALNADGESVLMPDPAGDGSLIIAVRLQTGHMDALKKFFYEDL